MLSINGPEFIVLAVILLLVVGPDRLPDMAQQLGKFVRQGRTMANNAREQVKVELGPEFEDVDWKKYDPRQYDPRRIVRDALFEETPQQTTNAPRSKSRDHTPFDPDAT